MLELKADGQAELKLLELLLPSGAQVSLTGASVSAAAQQQMNEMNYVIQTQQQQLDQAQATIAEYQQAMMALAAQSSQPRLLPASPTESKATALGETPRRYITGGLSQSKAITAQTQTAPRFARPHRYRLSLLAMVWSRRLAKPSLVLMLFCLVSWVVFRYVAPSVGAQLQTTTTVPTPAPAPAPKQESETPKPQSNLDQLSSPGSAASKAGTQPNALDL